MKITVFKNQAFTLTYYLGALVVCSYCETSGGKNAVSEEISELFKPGSKTGSTSVNTSSTSDSVKSVYKFFAEGSSTAVNVNPRQKEDNVTIMTDVMSSNLNQYKELKYSKLTNVTEDNLDHKINTKLVNNVKNKTVSQTLNATTLDFISGIGDLSHVNGSSSIKPRKGVVYSEIVPKKGVDLDDFYNYTLSSGHSCFLAAKDVCYDIEKYRSFDCECCTNGNALGKIISQQPLINCTTCLKVNKIDSSSLCNNICCKNFLESVTGKHGSEKNASSKDYQVYENNEDDTQNGVINKSNVSRNLKNGNVHSVKKKKFKPVVTNVPYDFNPRNPFNKSKGEKYVPIIVSIFILPLVGVFMFFLWKKIRELWERRYYKRMDFLIDGMYDN